MVNFRKLFTRRDKKKNSWKNRPNLPAGSAYNLTFKPPVVNKSRIVGISGGPETKKWWHKFTRRAKQAPRNPNLDLFGYYNKPPSARKSANKNLLTFSSPRRNNFLEMTGYYNKPSTRKVNANANLLTFPAKSNNTLRLKYPFEYPVKNSNTEKEKGFKSLFEEFMNTLLEFKQNPENKELERLVLEFARHLPTIRPLTEHEMELIQEVKKGV